MSAEPAERYPTVRALADELGAWLQNQEKGGALGRWSPAQLAGAAVALVVLAVMYAAWLPFLGRAGRVGGGGVAREGMMPLANVARHPQRAREKVELVYSRRGDRFHLSTCERVAQIKPENRQPLSSPEEAVAQKLKPCEICKPLGAESPQLPKQGDDSKRR